MDNYPSNSHNVLGAAEPKKKEKKVVEKVVTVDAIKRPKSIRRKMKTIFFGGEVRGAASYIGMDVLVPALRNLIVDATTKGVERVIYGDSPRRRYEPGRPRVSYNTPVDRGYVRPRTTAMLPDQPPHTPRARRQEVGDVILVSRDEAELVLERIADIIDKYDVASIADLNELIGSPSAYTDNNYGWSSMRGASVRQVREGYLLDLPPAEPISQ